MNQEDHKAGSGRQKAWSRRRFVQGSIVGIGIGLATGGLSPLLGRPSESARAASPEQRRAFLAAVAAGRLAEVRQQLAADPELHTSRDQAGRSAFLIAALAGHAQVRDAIREHGHSVDLHEAAFLADWETFDSQAAKNPEGVNRFHPIGGTAMYAAALGGGGSDMWHVYRYAADPNLRPHPASETEPELEADASGSAAMSPLRAALEVSDLAVAEMTAAAMASNGALATVPEPRGDSVLHAAAARGSVTLVDLFLRKGASTTARNDDGHTPIDLAVRNGHREAADLLRHPERVPQDHSTSRTAYDVEGKPYRPPATDGISSLDLETIVGLSHRNLDEVRRRVDGEPRLAHAVATTTERAVEACAHTGQREIVDFLLDYGAPYSLPTAVMRNDLDRTRQLLTEDPLRIHERGAHDFALLWYSIIGGAKLEMANLLLDAGAEVEQQHFLGTTALHWAALAGEVEMAELLIERGAKVDRPGRKFGAEAKTPRQLAVERDRADVVDLLERHGAR